MTAYRAPEPGNFFSSLWRGCARGGWRPAAVVLAAGFLSAAVAQGALVAYRVENGEIRTPLTREPGDAARGRAAVTNRDTGNCLLCHALPESGERFMGNLAPPLSGVGARLKAGELRLRIVDSSRLNRATIMPPYYRVGRLNQVAVAYRGKPILSAQQVEDVVAYLLTLR